MRPATNPELPELARPSLAETAYQIARTAERLGFIDYSDVLAEVARYRPVSRGHDDQHGAHRPRLEHGASPR